MDGSHEHNTLFLFGLAQGFVYIETAMSLIYGHDITNDSTTRCHLRSEMGEPQHVHLTGHI